MAGKAQNVLPKFSVQTYCQFSVNLKKKYHESCRLSFIWDKNEDYYSGDSNSDSSEKLPPERQEERSVLHTILAKRGM